MTRPATPPFRRPILALLACVGAVAFATSIHAQDEKPPADQPSSDQPASPAPLAGPEVEHVRPDRLEQGLTMGAMPGMQMGQTRQLPMGDVRELLEAMSAPEAPDELRITEEQSEALRLLNREHQARIRAFRAEHADVIESLRIRGGLHPVRIPDDQLSDTQRGARYELREFMQAGPTDADLQARIFAALTEPQRAHLNTEIDRRIEERARERRERLYADELNARPVDETDLFNADGTVDLEALPPRLRRQLKDVPEPRRTERLRLMLDRLFRIQGGERGGAERPTDKPKPAVETVQVPSPGG